MAIEQRMSEAQYQELVFAHPGGQLPVYQQRGDLEIWRIHPYERTLTTWQRQPDGSYLETVHREGIVRPASLPGVAIDFVELFDD